MKRRFFILGKFNTWYDWRLILTAKEVGQAEPKENYVAIDGADGSLDFTEALTGETTYSDRKLSASFMTDEGSHKDREALLRKIRTALHGRKIPITEPDDPDHYFLGRVKITEEKNYATYLEFTIEATCEPWRYAVNEAGRVAAVDGQAVDIVINNHGDKTLCPVLTVTGSVVVSFNGGTAELTEGNYKVTDLRLTHGPNVVNVSGTGVVVFTYREASL